MKAENYHPSLRPVEEACRLAKSGWVYVPNPLIGWGREGQLIWKAGVLLRHLALVVHCWRAARSPHILVREFSTIPLLLVFPMLWPLRRKLLFFIHHNLQWAVRNSAERFALRLLARLGTQWAMYEVQPDRMEVDVTVLHPVPGRTAGEKSASRPVIGVAGYYRPEKGMDTLLRRLTEYFPDCEIVAGVPNPDAVKIPGVRVVDTASPEDYRAMLSRCDVLVQNGEHDSYFYRASGPLADAAASGAAVVVPDFPLLRHQALFPVPVGEVFGSPDGMPEAVKRAVAKALAGQYDFQTYCEARSAQAVADRLDEFSRKQHG
jgi:glycosyltransferase involved in cell wall biosynthesis